MKSKHDIEKIFQDRQHTLDERPSGRAWDRLESRLDGQPSIRRHQRPAFRMMSIAATLLFLVAAIALISTMFQAQDRQTASMEKAMAPPVMEELAPFNDQKGVYAIAVSFQHYLNRSPKVFAEGPQHKKLSLPSPSAKKPSQEGGFLAQAEVAKKKRAAKARQGAAKNKDEERISENSSAIMADKKAVAEAAESKAAEYDASFENVKESAVVEREDAIVETPIENQGDYASGNTDASPAPPAPENASASKMKSRQKIDMASNAVTYSADQAFVGVEQFQWLIGQWQAPMGSNRQTIEQWKQKDEFTIEGSGQLVVNGDTTFTEGMRIQKIGENLYYILALDENNKEVRFQLRSINPEVAVFETQETGVPQQLIIEQHNFNNFSTTLQNAAPVEIEQNQIQYLQNRNNIELNQRTTRNMSRVKK